MQEIFLDTVLDSVRLIPFLFLTYLVMEWLEHKTNKMTESAVEKAGRLGPAVGAVLGLVPQCGFSAAGSSLYAGRLITLGTLISIYLSTSDEMLPVMLSQSAPLPVIGKILGIKMIAGLAGGMFTDLVICRYGRRETICIEEICRQEHCHCGRGIVMPALLHTIQVTFFLFLITFLLNAGLSVIGKEAVGSLLEGHDLLGGMIAALIGLVPNCGASVMLTQLYLEGILSFGALISGLLTGAGIGLAVLFRVNRHIKENAGIVCILYGIGVLGGSLVSLCGMS